MPKREIGIKKRGSANRKAKPVYLIIAEGKNKTETLYFSNYQEQGRSYSIRFVKAGSKTDAESLYKALSAKWKEMDLSEDNGDRGFIVLDIDNDPLKAEKITELIQSNANRAICFVASNPTFEIWFLLHFRYTTKEYPNGDAVIDDLKKYIPDYEKNKDVFGLSHDKLLDALRNADKLAAYHDGKAWPSADCNPRTDAARLVAILEGIYE